MDWKLIAAATVFGLYVIYRFRPVFTGSRAALGSLAEARKKIDAAKTDAERAIALAEAGDACAGAVGRTTGAVGYYTRAMRANPSSVEIVDRAAKGLARRPRALEQLLWRRLASESWDGDKKPAALAAQQDARTRVRACARVARSTRAAALTHGLEARVSLTLP